MISPYAILFANVPMFGQASHAKIAATFSTLEEAWNAHRSELLASGIETRYVDGFLTWKATHSDAEVFRAQMAKHNIRLIGLNDEEYPSMLRNIFDPPAFLFAQGAPLVEGHHLAMVGARKATTYGLESAHKLAKDIANGGITIVSGGAYGIDVACHEGALAARGKTIAVLGSGLLGSDNYRQTELTQRILASGGTVISEFHLSATPLKHHFPIRNRVVAGMCYATLVVEAGLPSGSMITATCATKENREVCAVPGNISSPKSQGTNFLIKNGAHCVTEAQDIFMIYGMNVVAGASATGVLPPGRSEAEIALFAVLSAEPLHIDIATERAKLSAVAASIAATNLEILGAIRDTGGKHFVIEH